RQGAHGAVELDRKLESLDVPLEVGDDLLARRVPVGVAREREAWQRAVAARREQDERVPAAAPRGAHAARGLEDHEPSALLRKEVPDREPGLAGADDGDLDAVTTLRPCSGLSAGLVHHPSGSRLEGRQTSRACTVRPFRWHYLACEPSGVRRYRNTDSSTTSPSGWRASRRRGIGGRARF